MDEPDAAVRAFTAAVSVRLAAGEPGAAALSNLELASAALAAGRPDQAADAAEDAIPELERIEDPYRLNRAKFVLAQALSDLNQSAQAVDLLAEAVEYYAGTDQHQEAGQCYGIAADLLDRLDRDAEAGERYEWAGESYALAGNAVGELHNRRRAALSWHWAGDRERCGRTLLRAERCTLELGAEEPRLLWERAVLRYDSARILSSWEQRDEAADRAATAAEAFAALDVRSEQAAALTLRGRVLEEVDRKAEAADAFRAALRVLPDGNDEQRAHIQEMLDDIG
ncbi:hypothetical protein [Herbihabitans rhizosphaerae]